MGRIDPGKLAPAGYARIRNAVLAKAYGDSPVLRRMTESLDDNMRNVTKALVKVAPRVAQARQAIADGALFDAAHIGWKFPVRALEDDLIKPLQDFAFYGPTCDDADYMKGPFMLPADIQAGDYIEIGMLGAYGAAMKTEFNGFGASPRVVVEDEPMASLYDGSRRREVRDNVVSLR